MRFLFWFSMLLVMWLVLSDSVEFASVLVGMGVSGVIALIYILLYPKEDFDFVRPVWLLAYGFVLIKNIIIANIYLTKILMRKDLTLSPAIIAIPTTLKSDWQKLLLANSITLTPGTLTLDIEDNMLFIHIIEYEEGMDRSKIIDEFERVIRRI